MLERLKRTGATPENIEAETREAVFDYFAGEIFERAPAQHQHLLISTAFLPRATADMAETRRDIVKCCVRRFDQAAIF